MSGNGSKPNGQHSPTVRMPGLDSLALLKENSFPQIAPIVVNPPMTLTPDQMSRFVEAELSRRMAEVQGMLANSAFAGSVAASAQALGAQFNQVQNQMVAQLSSKPGQSVRDRSTLRITIEET